MPRIYGCLIFALSQYRERSRPVKHGKALLPKEITQAIKEIALEIQDRIR